jgi:hypothetical protein
MVGWYYGGIREKKKLKCIWMYGMCKIIADKICLFKWGIEGYHINYYR